MSRRNKWHSATLTADPSARNVGKEWLTQQMNHNMHDPIALLPAVSYDEEFVHIDVQMSDDGEPFMCMERMQYSWPGTVQMLRRLAESNMQAMLFQNYAEMAST
ncbi:hypothetical protein DYB25_011410 [Aphanomyces astaci]|uniref:Uncharacterized protein n=1 Tax=Aphanomyces astaci TaxID=112090 RepID=A0A397B030_APHAT|nr:hypothetical protein DYB25_011410 [Aphanomyces astaci]